MAWLYGRLLAAAEAAAARLSWECTLLPCRPTYEALRREAERLLPQASQDPYAAYDSVKALAQRVLTLEASARASLAARQALAAGAGLAATILAAFGPTPAGGPIGLAAWLAAMILGVAAGLLSRYPAAGPLAAAAGASEILALLGHPLGPAHVAAAAAALAGVAASIIRGLPRRPGVPGVGAGSP